MFPEAPEWGYTGLGDEAITRYVLCCAVQEGNESSNAAGLSMGQAKVQVADVNPAEEHAMTYQMAMAKYEPHTFDRSNEWGGQTYGEALEFCENLEGGGMYQICSYDAVCVSAVVTVPCTLEQRGV